MQISQDTLVAAGGPDFRIPLATYTMGNKQQTKTRRKTGAYLRCKKWETNHGEREKRGAEGGGCGEEVSPSPARMGVRRGYVPPLNFFLDFLAQMASFGAFSELIA